MEDSAQDRQLPASPHKLRKAREDGQIPRSRDLGHFAVLGGGALALALLLPPAFSQLHRLLTGSLRFDALSLEPARLTERTAALLSPALGAWLPIALAVALAALLASWAVGGWVLSGKPLMPQFSRISPLQGLKRLLSARQAAETAKLVLLMALMCALAGWFLVQQLQPMAALLLRPLPAALQGVVQLIAQGLTWLLAVLLMVALADTPLQRFLHRRELRMSHQELKQEFKELEGNPHTRARVRQRQREAVQRASARLVPTADLVVMNPTHYAVALRYDESSMGAPRVVSKGADLLALRIRDIARDAQVPVVEAPMLARSLYAHADLGDEVPAALYTAVAQVLAWVYQLKASLRGELPAPAPFTAPEVPPELDPQHPAFRRPRRAGASRPEGAAA